MNLNNFYVLVDTENKIVIDKIQKLPKNWNNISGLSGLSDEQLCDLKWAGHHNIGWVNIHSELIKEYSSSLENLNLNKNTFKSLVTEIRKEKQYTPIEYNGAKIKADNRTFCTLHILKERDYVNFKCLDGYHTFTSLQMQKIYTIVNEQMQKYFDIEMKIYKQIDSCKSIADFLYVNYDM